MAKSKGSNQLVIKAEFDEEVRRTTVFDREELTFDELCFTVQRLFKKLLSESASNLVLKYRDADGDIITLYDTAELRTAIDECRDKPLRLLVFDLETFPPRRHSGLPATLNLPRDDTRALKAHLVALRQHLDQLIDAIDVRKERPMQQQQQQAQSSQGQAPPGQGALSPSLQSPVVAQGQAALSRAELRQFEAVPTAGSAASSLISGPKKPGTALPNAQPQPPQQPLQQAPQQPLQQAPQQALQQAPQQAHQQAPQQAHQQPLQQAQQHGARPPGPGMPPPAQSWLQPQSAQQAAVGPQPQQLQPGPQQPQPQPQALPPSQQPYLAAGAQQFQQGPPFAQGPPQPHFQPQPPYAQGQPLTPQQPQFQQGQPQFPPPPPFQQGQQFQQGPPQSFQ